MTIAAENLPPGGSVVISVDDPEVFRRWGDNGGTVEGGEVLPGQEAIQIPVQPDGGAEASIERIPLQPDEETSVTIDVVPPAGSESALWIAPWASGAEGEPQVKITQWVGGEAVGGNTFRPPRPLRVFLPLIAR